MQTTTNIFSRALGVLLFLALIVPGANAQSWDETTDGGGDAGDLVATAQGINASGSITTITGFTAPNDVDMYRIIVSTAASFSATTVGNSPDIDTILALVDDTGNAVYLNDDDDTCGGCLESTLPAAHVEGPTVDGGVYYLMIFAFDNHPQNAGGQPIFTYDGTASYTDVHGPSATPGPVAQYFGDALAESGTYEITLTAAEGDPTLPVELASFTAILQDKDVVLGWETFSEQNNQGFDVEVQDPGQTTFRSIGFVSGHGTTTEAQSYSFRAEGLEFGKNVFRLKQIDQDGRYAYSSTIEVDVELPTEFVMEAAYPNPFNPRATFEFAVQDQQQVRASLYNMIGQEVAELYNGVVSANEVQTVGIDGSGLPSGIYVVRVAGEKFEATQTISLLK